MINSIYSILIAASISIVSFFNEASAQSSRIVTNLASKKDVSEVIIKSGNVTLLHFQNEISEWYVGDSESYIISASSKTPQNLAIKVKATNVGKTNLIVKLKNGEYYFIDIIPTNKQDGQDFYEFRGLVYSKESFVKKVNSNSKLLEALNAK